MTKIKISCVGATAAKEDGSNPLIAKFLPNWQNKWKDCEFFLNDPKITKADYWIIIDDVDLDEEFCEVSPYNVIFNTCEPQSIRRYDNSKDFVKQFGRIYSSHNDFKYHDNLFPCRPFINWWIDAGNPIKSKEEFQSFGNEGLGYDDFKNLSKVSKTKLISVFCSDKQFTEGHKMRFNFCKKLKNHFKDQLDWFGSGVNPIDNKWNGIAPYKYHIVLENSDNLNYWTEKLIDPLMVLTYPIYYGAKNINDYFTQQKITTIDIKYPRSAIAKIEKIISENIYENNLAELPKMRDLIMDKYNLYNLIYEIIENDKNSVSSFGEKSLVRIRKEKFFMLKNSELKIKCRKNFLQRLNNSFSKKSKKILYFFIDIFLTIKLKIIK